MTTTLYFTREFTKGNLKGLQHQDKLDFVSVERAEVWLKGVTSNHAKGKLNYRIVDRSYQNYFRSGGVQ